ncbi:MAG: GAF domain-containing sensor histidine kinase [Cyanobacteria bacterium P01_F01_bin.13]
MQLISADLDSSSTAFSPHPLLQRVLAITQQGGSVQELARWLPAAVVENFDLKGCHIELYDAHKRTATLIGGVGDGWLGQTSQSHAVEQFWELYEPLTQGKFLLFSSQKLGKKKASTTSLTWLGCPMMSRTELLGSVWLTRPSKAVFEQTELNQLQQIASCVAIALHQSHLEATLAHQQTEIQQLRQAKDEFLQLISHELFIPLGSIQLSAQTLEKIFKDASWRKVPQRSQVLKVLSLLSQECRRQKQFVDNLITLMFPEYQKASEPVLMNLSDWLPSLLRTFEPRFEQESLPLKISIPEESLLIECDVAQLERIITELITNAIKYTPAKKTVTIKVTATDTDVKIAIANAGVQIPPDHQSRIFEKFYRVPELDQRQYGGSGLGLSLVKQLVANLDGTVEVKSTKQKTTFTVRLPR